VTISQRVTRAALAFLLFGLMASLLPSNGNTAMATIPCPNASPTNTAHR
jgi:hypothetical protein